MLTDQEKEAILFLASTNDLHHVQTLLNAIFDRDTYHRQMDTERTRADFAQSQLDNRNRRMQIAAWILDEENIPNLEELAEILWPSRCDEPLEFASLRPYPENHCPKNPAIPHIHQFGGRSADGSIPCIYDCGKRLADSSSIPTEQENFRSNPQDIG